jgi:hypothetical protein
MNNPRINIHLLRQALSSQFSRVMFRNGEMDKFDTAFSELSQSQKRSLYSLADDLAKMELLIRLHNEDAPEVIIVPKEEFGKFIDKRYLSLMQKCHGCDSSDITHYMLYSNGSVAGCCSEHNTPEV